MSDTQKTIRFGIAGLGGFSAAIRDLLMRCEAEPESGYGDVKVALTAACDPKLSTFDEAAATYRDHGAALFDSYEKMLAQADIDAVWLPVPIDLHRPFAEMAFAAGKAVMTEKPITGCVDDVDAMIAARDASGLSGGVAYQLIGELATTLVKRRLLDGAIGKIKRASVHVCWPRDDRYYGRSDWAGAMQCRGSWVLDGPAANAMSHFLHQSLFLLGESDRAAAVPMVIEAEQYRTRPIENNDTIAMRVQFKNDVMLTGLFTHACASTQGPVIEIEGTTGRYHWSNSEGGRMVSNDGTLIEEWPHRENINGRKRMVFSFAQSLISPELESAQAWTTFEAARSQVLVINGACEATPIYDVPASAYQINESGVREIDGIVDVFHQCARDHQLLHESGTYPWTKPAGRKDLQGYAHFNGPVGV